MNTFINRYMVGAAAELRLPARLAIEFDVLYYRLHLSGIAAPSKIPVFPVDRMTARGNAWQFPFLMKYRLLQRSFSPFVAAGPAIRRTGFSGLLTRTTLGIVEVFDIDENHTNAGWAAAGGVEYKLGAARISTEIRYSRFGKIACSRCQQLSLDWPAPDSVALLVGIGF